MMPLMAGSILRIAFLHLAPVPGDLAGNRRLIETAVLQAAQAGAAWVLTPELADRKSTRLNSSH